MKPRILHITRNMPPLVGGMERLNWHIADELSHWADVHVIAPAGTAAQAPAAVAVTEVPLKPLWRFLANTFMHGIREARRIRPDIVLAGSGLTAPPALWAARASRCRSAVYVHGLDVAVQHPVYRTLWHPAIRNMDLVIANSAPTAELVRALGVEPAKVRIVHPGVQIPDAPQPDSALQVFRKRHGLGSARLLLSVGRLTTRKGLLEFVQNALPAIVASAPDVLLIVVGDAPTQSLRAGVQTRASIQAAADAAGVGAHLRFLGTITDDVELACAYASAAAHVFPVRTLPGDPEGFGMVAVEAAAHGTPTAGFATGGIVDAVSQGQSGLLAAPGDYPELAATVLQILAGDAPTWAASSRAFAARFAWPELGRQIQSILQKLIHA